MDSVPIEINVNTAQEVVNLLKDQKDVKKQRMYRLLRSVCATRWMHDLNTNLSVSVFLTEQEMDILTNAFAELGIL